VGPAHAQVYAAQNNAFDNAGISAGPSNVANSGAHLPGEFSTGGIITPYNPITESAGGRITYGMPDDWTIGVTGVEAKVTGGLNDPYKPVNTYDNLAVYGADFSGMLPFMKSSGITVNGEFANTATGNASRLGSVNASHGTEAYDASLGYTFGPGNVKAGYKDIYSNFQAPGSWGQIGDWVNPTNVMGPVVAASYAFTPTLSLNADGNFFKGQYNDGNQNPLGKNDDLTSYDVGVKYGLTSEYSLDLGYEWVQWNLKNDQHLLNNAGKPTEQYVTFGVGHSFTQNASLKLLYQIINYNGDNTGFDLADNKENGGVAVTQLSVKF